MGNKLPCFVSFSNNQKKNQQQQHKAQVRAELMTSQILH